MSRPRPRGARARRPRALSLGPDPVVAVPSPERDRVPCADGQRSECCPSRGARPSLLPLEMLLAARRVSVRSDTRAGSVTLGFQGGRPSSTGRRASPPSGRHSGCSLRRRLRGRPLAGADRRVSRVIGPLLDVRAEWRPTSRLLILGNVARPRVAVATSVSGDSVRVVLEASEPLAVSGSARNPDGAGAGTRRPARGAVPAGAVTGGIVDLVQYQGDGEPLRGHAGRRFQELRSSEEPARLVLEFKRVPLPARAAACPSRQHPGPPRSRGRASS